jgi:glycosyltransferase involved in cell wall biosynthesis
MRKGQNPAKAGVQAYTPRRLGVATLVYIPVQEGYFDQSLEIFKIHLASLRQYTSEEFDFLVFDNGSCPEVKRELEKLHEQGLIDTLILSEHNLGKTGALNQILAGMPNEWICFADSDMLFREGWLDACWKINESFPNCGMVGAQVIFPDWDVDKGNTEFRKTSDPRFVFSQEQAPEWLVDEYCRARGASPERTQVYREMLLDKVRNTETGVEVYLGGNSHQQFLAPRAVLQQILPLPSGLQLSREQDTYQDRRIDELGYLHPTTTRPYLYHMGNTIDPEIVPEVNQLNRSEIARQDPAAKATQKNNLIWRGMVWLSRNPRTRRILLRLYNNLYEVFSS